MINTALLVSLCAKCQHTKIIKSSKGSVFVLCGLSKTDPRFSKDPPLPVVECSGYEQQPQTDCTPESK